NSSMASMSSALTRFSGLSSKTTLSPDFDHSSRRTFLPPNRCHRNGLKMPNPFVIGSGPPGTNYTVMKRAFDEGWGAVIAKTVSLDASKVINVTPRYARLKTGSNGSAKTDVIGWQNIELISDRPLETMLKDTLTGSSSLPSWRNTAKTGWEELIDRVEQTGVDALEINFSCPHGMPERRMGAAVGQTVHFWRRFAVGLMLKLLFLRLLGHQYNHELMGIDLKTLHPEPCVEGYSTPGGYSYKAVRPIALSKVMNIAQMMKSELVGKITRFPVLEVFETGL
ncbi:hypothetical protein HID58_092152, partial [Brassica napus]